MKIDKKQIALGLKGFTMGVADIVPGVSGGTIALITGVYDDLIKSISSVDKEFIKSLFRFEVMKCLEILNYKFLFPLLFGVFTALITMSKVMHYFMNEFSVYTWSLFFGLIFSSIIFLGKNIKDIKNIKNIGIIATGTLIGYAVVSLIPLETSNSFGMIFLAGCIGICAMILPGISGSFILLILGKYLYVTSALKNPFIDDNIFIIITFALGCLVGILSFSKVLNYFLKNHHNPMTCLLTGFMIGSMKKIWPWKEVIEQKIIRGKIHVIQDKNIIPTEFNSQIAIALVIMTVGISLVFILENMNKQK
jgi:putative membrane protein